MAAPKPLTKYTREQLEMLYVIEAKKNYHLQVSVDELRQKLSNLESIQNAYNIGVKELAELKTQISQHLEVCGCMEFESTVTPRTGSGSTSKDPANLMN